jgi:hypothetical protein
MRIARQPILTCDAGMAEWKSKPKYVQLDVHVAVPVLLQHTMGLDPSLDSVRCLWNSHWSCRREEQKG